MSLPEYITAFLAVWGAVLSTALAIREVSKDRHKIKIVCEVGIPVWEHGRPPDSDRYDMAIITAINVGHRPVEITGIGFVLTNKNQLVSIEDVVGNRPLPRMLAEGERVTMSFYLESIIENIAGDRRRFSDNSIKLLHSYARDSTGKVWTGSTPQLLKDRGFA
jgi:hypothetical protein